jgi:uncharacterized glyoxalase superfamily protein PhnB
MRNAAMKDLVKRSEVLEHPFTAAVRKATKDTEVMQLPQFVDASILEAELVTTGCTVAYSDGTKHGSWVTVADKTGVVARAFSHSKADALLQAVYAELRHEEMPAE